MFYQPAGVPGMGDQWLYYRDGVHYLYHLYEMPAGRLHGVYLATSRDGVHFAEVGPVIEKREDADWLGSGSVWRAGDRYLMNFSEARAAQSISFAESADLVHWRRLDDELRSDPDPRWYEVSRWDCIWAIPREHGGFWGYLSAVPWPRSAQHPDGLTYRSTGMLESRDGLRWTAVAPPVFEWGDTPQMVNVEVGAVTKIGARYYMLVQTWGDYLGNTASGMYTFVADAPRGPFRPDTEAYRLLGNTRHRSSHFLRFYKPGEELLVNHSAFARDLKAWLGPLKKARLDDRGHLRLDYWAGNDAAKGRPIQLRSFGTSRGAGIGSSGGLTVDGSVETAVALLDTVFDLFNGIVMEGSLSIAGASGSRAGCGLYLEEDAARGTAVVLGTDGRTELGTLLRDGEPVLEAEDIVQVGIVPDCRHTFRLLTRRSMLEVYVDDRLIQCYSIPERATGRIGFVARGGRAFVEGLRAWAMTFPASGS